jgi:hypothetical protein
MMQTNLDYILGFFAVCVFIAIGYYYGLRVGKPKLYVGDQQNEIYVGRELYSGHVVLDNKRIEFIKTTGKTVLIPYGTSKELMTNVLEGRRRKSLRRVLRATPCDLETWVRHAYYDRPLERQAANNFVLFYSGAVDTFMFVKPVAPIDMVTQVLTKQAEVADYWEATEKSMMSYENTLQDQREDEIRRTNQMISFHNTALKTLFFRFGDIFEDVLSRAPDHVDMASKLTSIEAEKLFGTSYRTIVAEGGLESAMRAVGDAQSRLQGISARLGGRFVSEGEYNMLKEYEARNREYARLIAQASGKGAGILSRAFDRARGYYNRLRGKEGAGGGEGGR